MPRREIYLLCLLLAACGEFPVAGDARGGDIDYPLLAPLAPILNETPQPAPRTEDDGSVLADRIAALEARADALRAATP